MVYQTCLGGIPPSSVLNQHHETELLLHILLNPSLHTIEVPADLNVHMR